MDSPYQYLFNEKLFVWFLGGPNFAIAFGNDVICYCWAFKLAYFVEHDISYQPSKFQLSRMSGSNFAEGGGQHPPPSAVPGAKSQVLLGLKRAIKATLFSD